MLRKFALLFLVAVAVFASKAKDEEAHLEPPDSKVVVLQIDDFFDNIKSYDLALVNFYASWCGHCKKMAGTFRYAASKIYKAVKFAKIDVATKYNAPIRAIFNIKAFPTLMVFQKGMAYPYMGESKNPRNFMTYMSAIKRGEQALPPSIFYEEPAKEPADSLVSMLDAPDYDAALAKHDLMMVEFWSPYDKHCQSLSDDYTAAAKELEGKAKLFKVNIGSLKNGKKFKRRFYKGAFENLPFIVVYKAGEVQKYNGGPATQGIVSYMTDMFEGKEPSKPSHIQMVDGVDNNDPNRKLEEKSLREMTIQERREYFRQKSEKIRAEKKAEL